MFLELFFSAVLIFFFGDIGGGEKGFIQRRTARLI
jgi:hypothetical protein